MPSLCSRIHGVYLRWRRDIHRSQARTVTWLPPMNLFRRPRRQSIFECAGKSRYRPSEQSSYEREGKRSDGDGAAALGVLRAIVPEALELSESVQGRRTRTVRPARSIRRYLVHLLRPRERVARSSREGSAGPMGPMEA